MVQHTELLVREAVKDEFLARPMTEAVARLLHGAELMRHSTQHRSASLYQLIRKKPRPGQTV
jgi:hypothetical protein